MQQPQQPQQMFQPLHTALALVLGLTLTACGGGGGGVGTTGGGANPGLWEAVTPIENTLTDSAPEALAINAAGNAIAVWNEGGTNPSANTYLAGSGWQTAVPVARLISFNKLQLAMSTNGSAMLVWQEGSNATIAAQRFVPGGGWQPIDILNPGTISSIDPQVQLDRDGNALVVWTRGGAIRFSRYTAATDSWSAPAILASDVGAKNPSLAMTADGNAIVAYQIGSPARIQTQRSSGGPWFGLGFADDGSGVPASAPEITLDNNGNATVAWLQNGLLMGSRQGNVGNWGPVQTLSTTTPLGYTVTSADDIAMVAWTEGPSPRISTITASAANGWANTVEFADAGSGTVGAFDVGMDASGNAVALWADGGILRANRFTPAGGWGALPQRVDDNAAAILRPKLAVSANGTAMAIWQQDNAPTNIVSARFTP